MKSVSEFPAITVGVPVHNGAKELERCLKSLQDQTYPNFSVVIFENASSDDSLRIAEAFCADDSRFSIQPSQALLPARENFRRALKHCSAQTPLFCLRAHDDYSDANFLSELAGSLIENPQKTVAVALIERISASGKRRLVDVDLRMQSVREFVEASNTPGFWKFPGSWYYGLYRGPEAASTLIEAADYLGSPWGSDRLATMTFVLKDQLVINHDTVFYCQRGSGSARAYKEKTPVGKIRARSRYFLRMKAIIDQRRSEPDFPYWKALQMCWQSAKQHTSYYGFRLFF